MGGKVILSFCNEPQITSFRDPSWFLFELGTQDAVAEAVFEVGMELSKPLVKFGSDQAEPEVKAVVGRSRNILVVIMGWGADLMGARTSSWI
jgi:hypothetical protein